MNMSHYDTIARKILEEGAGSLTREHSYVKKYEGGKTKLYIFEPLTANEDVYKAIAKILRENGGKQVNYHGASEKALQMKEGQFALYTLEEPGKNAEFVLSVNEELLNKVNSKVSGQSVEF